jgi:hypothetical protein
MTRLFRSAGLLHDQQEIHLVNLEGTQGHIGKNGNDLTFQVIQELFQFSLILGHAEIKTMDTVFCGYGELLSLQQHHCSDNDYKHAEH